MTSGSLKEVLECLQGSIYFVQKLTASNVPTSVYYSARRRTSCKLVIPRWFLREHGDKFRRSVLVRSGSNHEPWRHWLSIYRSSSQPMPQVSFASGWNRFVSVHGLVKGDYLIFSLATMSEFHVYMFDQHGDPKILSQNLGLGKWVMCPMCAKPKPPKCEHEPRCFVPSQDSADFFC